MSTQPVWLALTCLRPRQALSQCDGYLTRMGVVKEAVDDTAGAAKAIAQQQLRCGLVTVVCAPKCMLSAGALSRDCAAVASSRAGELYGMQMMDQGIQDDQDNFT